LFLYSLKQGPDKTYSFSRRPEGASLHLPGYRDILSLLLKEYLSPDPIKPKSFSLKRRFARSMISG